SKGEEPQSNSISKDPIELQSITNMEKIGDVLIGFFRRIPIELLLLHQLNQRGLQLKIVGLNSGPNNTTATADSSRSDVIFEGSPLIIMPSVSHIILNDFFSTIKKNSVKFSEEFPTAESSLKLDPVPVSR
ncbi:hypothetical protein PIB30_064007, partial [Stylosanthes scabra]|nr:hypothetical protein [Stylosanthes scabra]